jgi:hypothetical protein
MLDAASVARDRLTVKRPNQVPGKRWQRWSIRERFAFLSGAIMIEGKVITFDMHCREIDPKSLGELEIASLERSHGWKIKRD